MLYCFRNFILMDIFKIIFVVSSLISLGHDFSASCTVTQVPALACRGDDVTVECEISVPDSANNNFRDTVSRFIVGNHSNSVGDNDINNKNTIIGGVDLSRLTAFANSSFSGDKIIRGSLTLSSYTASDAGIRLGCTAVYYLSGNSGDTTRIIDTTLLTPAAPPSAPSTLSISSSNIDPNTCSATVSLNWTAPSSTDRTVDLYYLSLQNGTALDSIAPPANSYSHNTTLLLDTVYAYSVHASSCAGNSTTATFSLNPIDGYSLSEISSNLPRPSYENEFDLLKINWNFSAPTPTTTLLIEYSLTLNYSHTQGNETRTFSDSTSFSLLSSAARTSTRSLTPHSFVGGLEVETNITAVLRITQQCGQSYSGTQISCSISSTSIPTLSTPVPTSSSLNTALLVIFILIVSILLGVWLCYLKNNWSRHPPTPLTP